MEEKQKQTPEDLEKEILQIEQDFQNIVGEMTDIANIRQFTGIYRQLHTLLLDSHNKNNQLTSAAQLLNSQIISNATTVSSLRKMSEDDHKCIEQYRDEFDKAWKLVNTAQEKEMKSKEICEDLKQQVDKLAALVHEQSVSDAHYNEVQIDLTNFKDEKERNDTELQVLNAEIEKSHLKTRQVQQSFESSKTETTTLEESVALESDELDKLTSAKVEYYNQIEKLKNETKSMTTESEDLDEKIKKTKNNIDKLKMKKDSLNNELNESKTQYNASTMLVKEKEEQMETVKGTQISIMNRIHRAQSELDSKDRYIEMEKQRIKALEEMIKDHQAELDETKALRNQFLEEIKQTERDRKETSKALIAYARDDAIMDSNVKATQRENDAQARRIQVQKTKLNKEKTVNLEVRNTALLTERTIDSEKKGIEQLNLIAHQLDLETKNYMKQTNETKVNSVRFIDNNKLTIRDLENSTVMLKRLEQQSKSHQAAIDNLRKDRDQTANQIHGVERENEELDKNIISLQEELDKLKRDAQEKAKECIMEHFKSRSLEKQNNSLKEMVDITQKMTDEAMSTIIKYKAEATKLNLIILESQKDITHAHTELTAITEVIQMLKSQLAQRKLDVAHEKERAESLYYELDRRYSKYGEQSEMLSSLDMEMTRAMEKNKRLRSRTSSYPSLVAEKIALESSFLRERELCNKLELEFSRPLNVHRWTIMQQMNPEQYKQIQMIQYLKGKLEEVERQKIKLDAKKAKVLQEIGKSETRVKNMRYTNDSEALLVMKDAVRQKDLEMEQTQKEIEAAKLEMEQLKEQVMELRLRVKETKVKSTNLKRANQNMAHPQVPMLPINQKPFEMTRLGGGFSLASSRPNTARAEPLNSHQLYETNEVESRRPMTARNVQSAQRTTRRLNNSGSSSARSERSSSVSGRNSARSTSSRTDSRQSSRTTETDFSAKRRTASTSSARRKSGQENTESSLSMRRKMDIPSISTGVDDDYDEPQSARRKRGASRISTDSTSKKKESSNFDYNPPKSKQRPIVPPVSISSLSTNSNFGRSETIHSSRRNTSSQNSARSTSSTSSTNRPATSSSTSRTTKKTARDKNTAPAQQWVPPTSSFKPQFDDMPGLIISSARRQKDSSMEKKVPTKTASRK